MVHNKPYNILHLYHLRNWNSLNSTLKNAQNTYMHQVFSVFALQYTVTLEEKKKQKMKAGDRMKVWNRRERSARP
jgi:hypothetical protein